MSIDEDHFHLLDFLEYAVATKDDLERELLPAVSRFGQSE
jgi:hypothetical protein